MTTTRVSTALLTLAAALIAATASAQVTVSRIRPSSVRPPQPVVSAVQRRLPSPAVRASATKPVSESYRAGARASASDVTQQPRPSLGALANAARARAAKPLAPPVIVTPPLRVLQQRQQ